jgi:hypothetical protein
MLWQTALTFITNYERDHTLLLDTLDRRSGELRKRTELLFTWSLRESDHEDDNANAFVGSEFVRRCRCGPQRPHRRPPFLNAGFGRCLRNLIRAGVLPHPLLYTESCRIPGPVALRPADGRSGVLGSPLGDSYRRVHRPG